MNICYIASVSRAGDLVVCISDRLRKGPNHSQTIHEPRADPFGTFWNPATRPPIHSCNSRHAMTSHPTPLDPATAIPADLATTPDAASRWGSDRNSPERRPRHGANYPKNLKTTWGAALLALGVAGTLGCGSGKAVVLEQAEWRSRSGEAADAGGARADVAQTDGAPTIDGTPSEWTLDQTMLERNDLFNFHAASDGEFLYLYVEVLSQFHQFALRRSGFTVYLSNDPKNRRKRGVSYPSGTFNLLRDDPGFYDEFLRNPEWMQKPENQEFMERLDTQVFELATMSERRESKGRPVFANYPLGMVQSEGALVAVDTTRRTMGIEWRIPLDGTAPFQLRKGETVIGFAIEPPRFVFQDEGQQSMGGAGYYGNDYRYGGYGGYGGGYSRRARYSQADRAMGMRRAMGEYEKWFTVRFD